MNELSIISTDLEAAATGVDYGESRSLENPTGRDEELDILLAPGRSTAATADVALTYAAVWRAVNLISRDIAKLPLQVLMRLADGGKEPAITHPAYSLLRDDANSEQTSLQVKMYLQAAALLHGNGYALIQFDGRAAPISLIPLSSDRVNPMRVNGVLVYEWTSNAMPAVRTFLQPWEVLHIRAMTSWDTSGVLGISVMSKAAASFGLGLAVREYGSRFFANSAAPGLILEHPLRLNENERTNIKRSWEDYHRGLSKGHRTALLEEGMTARPVTINAQDAQLIETRKFEIREIANWFGVPAFKLQDEARTSFASLEVEQQAYLDEALDPWLCIWEDECRRKLLTQRQRSARSHLVEFTRQALVRSDLKTRVEAYRQLIQTGVMTPNEARLRESMNTSTDEGADKLWMPLNITQLDADRSNMAEPAVSGDGAPVAEPAAALQRDRVSALVRRVLGAAARAAHREDFAIWIETELEAKFARRLVEDCIPLARAGRSATELAAELLTACRAELLESLALPAEDRSPVILSGMERLRRTLPDLILRST